jgi:hypothetical protein
VLEHSDHRLKHRAGLVATDELRFDAVDERPRDGDVLLHETPWQERGHRLL